MTNNIKLKVGQWVKLNNGERREVRKSIGSAYYIGPYVYKQDGLLIMAGQSHPLSVARILRHMTLPNGDVLFEGDYAKRRDGEIVGPLEHDDGPAGYPWSETARGWGWWNQNGKHQILGSLSLIARADPPEAGTQDEPKLLRDMTKPDKFHQHEALHTAYVLMETWHKHVMQSLYVKENAEVFYACMKAYDFMNVAYQAIGGEELE